MRLRADAGDQGRLGRGVELRDDGEDLRARFAGAVDGLGEAPPECPVGVDGGEAELVHGEMTEPLFGGGDRHRAATDLFEQLLQGVAIHDRSPLVLRP